MFENVCSEHSELSFGKIGTCFHFLFYFGVFKNEPILRKTIFPVLRDCYDGKNLKNKKKRGDRPQVSAELTENSLLSAKKAN